MALNIDRSDRVADRQRIAKSGTETYLASADRFGRLDRRPRLLVAQTFGEGLERAFSGTTYCLARAGVATETLEGALTFYSPGDRNLALLSRAAVWKATRRLRLESASGFKFAPTAADTLWRQNIEKLRNTTVISNFQVVGDHFIANRRRFGISSVLYIDGTLDEYFTSYAIYDAAGLAASTKERAIEAEGCSFRDADLIITMSQRSRKHLMNRYGVSEDRIAVVPPGANISAPAQSFGMPAGPFTLGFVGLYPLRKGLDIIADALRLLRAEGHDIRLRVVGNCPDNIARQDGVTFVGRINKATELEGFLGELSSIHLGCMLSRAELAGIATLEFLACGIPALGTDVGGATDILDGRGCIMVPPETSPPQVADIIRSLATDTEKYNELRNGAVERSTWATWNRATRDIGSLLTAHGM